MEAGVSQRNSLGKGDAEDEEEARLHRSCAGLVLVYFRKMRGVRAGSTNDLGAPRVRL